MITQITNTAEDKRAHIKRIAALTQDKAHIHREARLLVGVYLHGSEQALIESEIANLDEEIREDRELYDAYEALIEAIAQEAVRIGRDLVKLSALQTEQSREVGR